MTSFGGAGMAARPSRVAPITTGSADDHAGRAAYDSDYGARQWSITPALVRGIALPIIPIVLGIVLGRPEFVVLLAPVLVGTLLAIPPIGVPWRPLRITDPHRVDAVSVTGARVIEADTATRVGIEIDPSLAEFAVVTLPPESDGAVGRLVLRAPALDEARRQVAVTVTPPSWGMHELARPDHLLAGADGLYAVGPVTGVPFTAQVLPPVDAAFGTGPLPPRPSGIVGAHHTRRRGAGSELYDIAPFQPGDRLRRIDWRVTARQTGPQEQLFTRHTLVDSDADIVCCLDNRRDLRPDVSSWAEPIDVTSLSSAAPGSLDIGVRTVLGLARSYLAHGDRVGVVDLARPLDVLHVGSGSRHLRRLRTDLARHARKPGTGDAARLPRRLPEFPRGALVVVTSVFLDDDIARLALSWRRAGHPVLAVDVLPELEPIKDPDAALALRLIMTERTDLLRSMQAHGIPVTPADPARIVLELTRLSRVPRTARR